MRINKFVAQATGFSRRAADTYIAQGRVEVNGQKVTAGHQLNRADKVTLDGKLLKSPTSFTLVMLNKPVGYVASRDGQGSKTIYDILPALYHKLKPVGRLDKDSSGLLLLTDNGQLAQELTHPSYRKEKVYEIELDKPLSSTHQNAIEEGVMLEDGLSSLKLSGLANKWTVTMSEGRNRQIRRTFGALGYNVVKLHRTQFGAYKINPKLQPRQFQELPSRQ